MKKKTFKDIIDHYDWDEIGDKIRSKTKSEVEWALSKERLEIDDLMALLSPAAEPYLEQMASLSRKHTLDRYGKTIRFFIPLYLSNSCTNYCVYCGFNRKNKIKRIILSHDEILQEIKAIKEMGDFQNIILLTGEDPKATDINYINEALEIAKPYFSNIEIEVYPQTEDNYRRLSQNGLFGVTCFQETYNKKHYKEYHPAGKKSDFDWRLEGFDRMGRAGIHKIGLGVLIGLEDWRTDLTMLALHLKYMEKTYWKTKFSISFPRIRPHVGESFQPAFSMSDRQLAQAIFAFRIFDHNLDLALSTRDSKSFRNHMLSLGITSISVASKTEPGGYSVHRSELEQFATNDDRLPKEMIDVIHVNEYEVVWKDWDLCLQ